MIPFSPPRIDQKIIDAVTGVLKSGWITTGPKTKSFEQKLSAYGSYPNTLCLNSATAGLELILRWYGVTEGDEVIIPAYTYSATANVVIHCGAKPVFADVHEDDFNINPDIVRHLINEKTKVIMPVDFGGFPCQYSRILALVNEPSIRSRFKPSHENQKKLGRILVLSDAAHSLGAEVNGKKTGSLTDVSVFSFHAVKNLTTAEGGAIALNLPAPFDNAAEYASLCIKSLHGQNKDALAKTQKGNWRYDIVEAGYKCNMTDIMAAMGLVELERYDSETLPRRKDICRRYSEALAGKSWARIPVFEKDGAVSSYHLYPLRIHNITEAQRDKIIALVFEKDVSVNVHFLPVPGMSFYKNLGYKISDYPVAFDNYSREISLPVFYDLNEKDQNRVIEVLVNAVETVLNG
jgi:dTDP-4-amino-4,6-dideoxygalactose transaminase